MNAAAAARIFSNYRHLTEVFCFQLRSFLFFSSLLGCCCCFAYSVFGFLARHPPFTDTCATCRSMNFVVMASWFLLHSRKQSNRRPISSCDNVMASIIYFRLKSFYFCLHYIYKSWMINSPNDMANFREDKNTISSRHYCCCYYYYFVRFSFFFSSLCMSLLSSLSAFGRSGNVNDVYHVIKLKIFIINETELNTL